MGKFCEVRIPHQPIYCSNMKATRRHSYLIRTWNILQPSTLLGKEKNRYNSSDKNINRNENTTAEHWDYLKDVH